MKTETAKHGQAKPPYSYRKTTANYNAGFHIAGPGGGVIAQGLSEANAAFIVRAVNAHEKLVEAMRRLIFETDIRAGCPKKYIDAARAALALAERKE